MHTILTYHFKGFNHSEVGSYTQQAQKTKKQTTTT